MIDESKTLHGQAREFILRLGYFIRMVGESIQPDYWVCTSCGNIEYYEREIRCWKCGIGEMIYKGDLK
jgi:hypothetical protein